MYERLAHCLTGADAHCRWSAAVMKLYGYVIAMLVVHLCSGFAVAQNTASIDAQNVLNTSGAVYNNKGFLLPVSTPLLLS